MKKYLAIAAAIAVVVGSAVGVRASGVASGSSACPPPLTLMESETSASMDALEAYIATEIAPLFKNPDVIDWTVGSFPKLTPSKISGLFLVGEQFDGFASFFGPKSAYSVVMERECAGGEWEVVKFKRVGEPEPLAQKPE